MVRAVAGEEQTGGANGRVLSQVLLQHRQERRWDVNGPDSASGLGCADRAAALRTRARGAGHRVLVDLAADADPSGAAVDVRATQLEELTLASSDPSRPATP